MASSTPFDGTVFLTSVPDDSEPHGNDYQEHQSTRKSMEFVNNKEHEALANPMSTSVGGGVHKNGSSVAYFTSTAPTLRPDGLTALADNAVDKGRVWIDSSDNVIRQKTWNGSAWVLLSNDLVGSITEYAGSSAPTGYLLCDGSTGLSTVANPEYVQLFAVIGIVYGGTSTTDFALPDRRGRVGIGVGTGDASGATAHTLGGKEGAESTTLSAVQSGLPAHDHPLRIPDASYSIATGSNSNRAVGTGTTTSTTNVSGTVADNPSEAASTAHTNLQPSLGLNYIIKI